jgi:hypothetical protein
MTTTAPLLHLLGTTRTVLCSAGGPGVAGAPVAVSVEYGGVYEIRPSAPVLFGTSSATGPGSLQEGVYVDPAAPLQFLADAAQFFLRAFTAGDVVVSITRVGPAGGCGCGCGK